jgi:hypothetical protein
VRDALEDAPVPTDSAQPRTQARTAAPVPRQRWIVAGGTSGHPRRILITEPSPEHRLPDGVDAPAPATVADDAPPTPTMPLSKGPGANGAADPANADRIGVVRLSGRK